MVRIPAALVALGLFGPMIGPYAPDAVDVSQRELGDLGELGAQQLADGAEHEQSFMADSVPEQAAAYACDDAG